MNNKDCQSDYSSENEFDVLDSIQKLKSVILQLPMPNRDSLAFLFIHFKRVVEAKIVTKMDTEALTMVFGPILVRGSSSNTISHRLDLNDQLVVVGALMKISKIFWNGLLNDPNFNPFNGLYIFLFYELVYDINNFCFLLLLQMMSPLPTSQPNVRRLAFTMFRSITSTTRMIVFIEPNMVFMYLFYMQHVFCL